MNSYACTRIGTIDSCNPKIHFLFFYQNASGREPVRDWIKGLAAEDRKIIGEDIKNGTVWLAPWDANHKIG